MTDPTFHHVTNIERPLNSIRNFANALALISEALDEPGASVVQEIAWNIRGFVETIEGEYSALFRLSHPDRERFEREGRPSDEAK